MISRVLPMAVLVFLAPAMVSADELFRRDKDDLPIPEPAEDATDASAHSEDGKPEGSSPPAELSLIDDLRGFPGRLWRDVRAIPTWRNAAILSVAGGLSAISSKNWDRPVRREISSGPQRFGGEPNSALDNGGESLRQLGGAAVLYAASLAFGEPRLHEASRDAFHALAIEIPTLIGLKQAFDSARFSARPDLERRGFPSGHVASTAAVAAVLHENFGPWAGSFGYLFTAAVAFHRMDTKNHDLSDVIFGGAVGYVIGSTVSRNGREEDDPPVRIAPRLDPVTGIALVALEARF